MSEGFDAHKIYAELDAVIEKLQVLNAKLKDAEGAVGNYMQSNSNIAQTGQTLWNGLTQYGSNQDEQAGKIFAEIEEAQKQLESLREPLVANFAENFNRRVTESVQSANSFMSKKDKYIHASQQQFDASLKTIGAFTKKAGRNTEQYNKKMQELLKAKGNHEQTLSKQLSSAKSLNQGQYLAVVESVLSMLEAQYTYYGQGYAILHEYLPKWKENLFELKNQLPLMSDDAPPPPPM